MSDADAIAGSIRQMLLTMITTLFESTFMTNNPHERSVIDITFPTLRGLHTLGMTLMLHRIASEARYLPGLSITLPDRDRARPATNHRVTTAGTAYFEPWCSCGRASGLHLPAPASCERDCSWPLGSFQPASSSWWQPSLPPWCFPDSCC